MQALGFIETQGLVAAIEAADSMLKAADVRLAEKTKVGSGLITVTVTGDVAAVKAAVDAGVAAANRIQDASVVSCHVIPRPHDEIANIMDLGEKPAQETALEEPVFLEQTEDQKEEIDDRVTEQEETLEQEEIEEVQEVIMNREFLDKLLAEGKDQVEKALETMKVTELRLLARDYPELSIAGRQISKANKHQLLKEFKKYFDSRNKDL